MTVHRFPCAIYKPTIMFVTTPRDWAEQVEWYGHAGVPYPRGGLAYAARFHLKDYSPVIILAANRAKLLRCGPATIADTCAHEATHVMRFVCENVGEDFLGYEAEAHLVGALAGWMWKIIVDGRVN